MWLSSRAFEEIEGKLPFAFESRGEQQVKNIARPVRAYALAGVQAVSRPEPARVLLLPDKPSLAVLPFANLSGPEDDYFCDGLVEDIITALSRVRWFFVIARNSSFTYKGQAIDIRRVGRELGVRYVLEGAVRKSASRIRITGQLVEAETGHHLWADKFDGNLADIFDLQDQLAEQVAAAIEPSLRFAEVARASTKPTENLTAYDLYLRALPHRYALSEVGARTALAFATAAIEHDPRFATAKALAAYCYAMFVHQDWDEPDAADKASALAHAAVDDGWDDPEALRIAGHVLGGIARDHPAALIALDRALALNPNSAAAWTSSGWVRVYVDAFETAIDHFGRAMRLSPLDPEMYFAFGGLAHAHLGLGNVAEALAWSEKCARQHKGWSAGFRVYIECLALAGRMEEARAAAARYLATYPGFRIAKWAARTPVRNPEIVRARQEVYRAVGLPE